MCIIILLYVGLYLKFLLQSLLFKYYYLNFQPTARTKDYWMMIGYREENERLETAEKYLRRIEACMMLYGAIIQVEAYPKVLSTFSAIKPKN